MFSKLVDSPCRVLSHGNEHSPPCTSYAFVAERVSSVKAESLACFVFTDLLEMRKIFFMTIGGRRNMDVGSCHVNWRKLKQVKSIHVRKQGQKKND